MILGLPACLAVRNPNVHVTAPEVLGSRCCSNLQLRLEVVRSGPWSQRSPEVITDRQGVVAALTAWGEMLAKVPFSQRENLIITYEPEVPVRSEAQLHSRVAAMGIPVFAKGTSPTKCPFGIQGGQAGQQSVAITHNREPATKFTIQRQGRKDNIS